MEEKEKKAQKKPLHDQAYANYVLWCRNLPNLAAFRNFSEPTVSSGEIFMATLS